MAQVFEKLTAQDGEESADALNDIVRLLWPNINVAGSKMIKEMVEPMFKTMLPGPLSTLHFTKIDLGHIPLELSNAKTTKTEADGIKIDLNLDWKGKADIEMDADLTPALGVESIELYGRLTILLCPITDVLPLIGAIQMSFINPPILKLDFTGAADVADSSLINGTVRKIILGLINSMFTLPNRFLYKLDANADYFKTFHHPLGMIRITVEKAWGFSREAKSSTTKFFHKLTGAAPDCYASVEVGGEEPWRTSTKNNTHNPSWQETHDFVVSDLDQCIKLDIEDHDVNADDEIGIAVTTIQELLEAGGRQELALVCKGTPSDGKVAVSAKFFKYIADASNLTASEHSGDGHYSGIATILIAGATGIKGQRETLKPSVVVTYGASQRFQTAVKEDFPGTDINNPAFDQSFRFLITSESASSSDNFRIALLDGEQELGAANIPFADVSNAANNIVEQSFDVGNGASIRACVYLRGVRAAGIQELSLPERPK